VGRGKTIGADPAGGKPRVKGGRGDGHCANLSRWPGKTREWDISIDVKITLAPLIHFYISRNMKNATHIQIYPIPVELASSQFAALGSEQRLTVLRILVRAGPEGLTIGALGERSGVTGSTLTHHMKILAAAGLVTQKKQGRSIICAAAEYDVMRALSDYLLLECCADCGDGKGHTHD